MVTYFSKSYFFILGIVHTTAYAIRMASFLNGSAELLKKFESGVCNLFTGKQISDFLENSTGLS